MFQTLQAKGQLIDISSPIIMGILNLTPDSFFDGGQHNSLDNALRQAEKMLNDGAIILDLGAYSTRPNAELVSIEEEKQRLIPILEAIIKNFPQAILSVDTFNLEVAQEAYFCGAAIFNDVSGGNEEIFRWVAQTQMPYILTHSSQNTKNLTQVLSYQDMILDMIDFFQIRINQLRNFGAKDILIDVGFGFGKNLEQNYELLKRLDEFGLLNLPMLVGISRKSMIWKKLNITPAQALNGTSVLHTIALCKGAKILRVHDVKEAKEVIELYKEIK